MADRILKPDSGNDLVLQNDDASAKIEINEDGSLPVTGTLEGSMTVGSGKTLNVSSGTFTTSSAQKTAIVDGGKGNLTASDVGLGNVTNDAQMPASGGTFSGNVSFGDNNITNVGDISLDTISSDGGTSIGVTLGTDSGDDFNVGSGKLVVEGDTGNVGIGLTPSSGKLHISQTGTGTTNRAFFWSMTGGHGLGLYNDGSNNVLFGMESQQNLQFMTNAVARMTIDKSTGKVGIGTDDPLSKLTVQGTFGGNTEFLTVRSTGTVLYRSLYFTNTHLYFWNGTNNPYLSGTGVWTDASDISIKKDIQEIQYGLETVNALKPRRYKHIACDSEDIGFVAQEVEEIVPEVVTGGEDESTGKGLAYGHLTAILTKAVQELSEKIDKLEARMTTIENA